MILPILTILDQHLIELLRSLQEEEWDKPTRAKRWTVKDVASHLLDGNVRAISMHRDKYFGLKAQAVDSYQDLVNFLNRMNADWIVATKRMSPALLTDLLELTGPLYISQLATLDPEAEAIFSVAWAGEEKSTNRFHVAREYTEKYHHQLQIREAVGRTEEIRTRQLYYPFIATLLHGLPHMYRNVKAAEGTAINVIISSALGGCWNLSRANGQWHLQEGSSADSAGGITIDPDTAWKVFTKGITKEEALTKAKITGDGDLVTNVLNMISVMA